MTFLAKYLVIGVVTGLLVSIAGRRAVEGKPNAVGSLAIVISLCIITWPLFFLWLLSVQLAKVIAPKKKDGE